MRTTVYLCACGGNIGGRLDGAAVRHAVGSLGGVQDVVEMDFLCAAEGQAELARDLQSRRTDRVVVAACSPREHETTFREVLGRAGMNPYLLQVVNVREQVVWVTADPSRATAKAIAAIRAGVARVQRHQPLEARHQDACTDVAVLGAGPAGLAAAQLLASAGRHVVLVETSPVLGGMPITFENVCPTSDCGSSMLHTMVDNVLRDPHVEVFTLSRLVNVAGTFGHFIITVEQEPRGIDATRCIGCGECVTACPVVTHAASPHSTLEQHAVSFARPAALPHVPMVDRLACARSRGVDCQRCLQACPVDGAVNFHDSPRRVERRVGALLVATGAALDRGPALTRLGHGPLRDVMTSVELEASLALDGPTHGQVFTSSGVPPHHVALIHCVGSLDPSHHDYCSAVCCAESLKLGLLLAERIPGVRVTHFHRNLCLPGKEGAALLHKASSRPATRLVRYNRPGEIHVHWKNPGHPSVRWKGGSETVDLVVLCPAMVPAEGTTALSGLLGLQVDRHGFLEPLHSQTATVQTAVRGVYVAGTCQGPMDTAAAITQGAAAAGHTLATLVEGRRQSTHPVVAVVDEDRCSGCRACQRVCPFQATRMDPERNVATINPVLCVGCGTCVAGCPSGCITGLHFTDEQLAAEIEALLS